MLEASHRAVVAANAQIRVLSPAQTAFGEMQQAEADRSRANHLSEVLPAYRESWRENLLTAQAAKLESERRRHEEAVRTIQGELVNKKSTLADLELRERQSGGDQIAGWEAEKARREQDRDRAMRERGKVEAAARELGEALPPTAEAFRTLVEAAAAEEAGAAGVKKARDGGALRRSSARSTGINEPSLTCALRRNRVARIAALGHPGRAAQDSREDCRRGGPPKGGAALCGRIHRGSARRDRLARRP